MSGSLLSQPMYYCFMIQFFVVPLVTAKIKKWHKQEGDMMQYEDEICDIELEVSHVLMENIDFYSPRILFSFLEKMKTHIHKHTLGLYLHVDC